MATQSLSPEMTSYARLCLAINDVCTESLRDVLLRNVPSQDIKQAIVARWGHQYNKPMFNKYPYFVLFPNHQLDPNFSVSDCDLSLLYFLIRNVSSVQKPLLGWGKSVMNNPQDTSIGANVERLHELRNTVIHLQEPRLSNEEFNSYWNKLRDCVTYIDTYLGGTKYQQKLECLKTDDMDPDYANRLIKSFRSSLQDLQARQHEQGQTLSDIREVLNQGVSEVKDLIKDENRQLPQIAKDVNETKDMVKVIRELVEGKGESRASTHLESMKGNDLLICQRRLEYLGQRLQDLAVEIGDGQGALWFKQNLWFLNKPAEFIDDVLFGVGKICNHLSSYLLFKKQKIKVHFPLKTFVGILHDISDTLSIARDILLHHPEEKLSVKQSQIELFWKDCTPFLFIFEEKNCSFLQSDQIPTFLYAIMDLIPTTIQVGLGLYCSSEPRLRGLDCFRRTCLRLLEVLVDQGEFLTMADQMEPVLISFLRQWVLYAIEVLQNGVKTPMTEWKEKSNDNNQERQRPKTWFASSQDDQGDFEEYNESDAEMCLGPLKVYHSSRVRATCLPSRWLKVARARMVCCPNELRKHCLEEAGLKENQKLVSNIYLAAGPQNSSCKGIKLHCPLIKKYEDLSLRLFVKVKKGEEWRTAKTKWEQLYDKGQFLTFEEEFVEGFMAVEEIPMVLKEIGPKGGRLSTEYDKRIEAEIPTGVKREISTVKMMIQPVDCPREQLYRESCPDVFHCIKYTSSAVEIDGASSERDIAIKIPFDVMKDAQTKILVLKYTNDHIEVRDASNLEKGDGNFYTITSRNGGTVLATVDPDVYGQNTSDSDIRQEMEVILGKKQLCKLLIFVELQHNKLDLDNCVFQIVCAEKYRVDEVIREKSKSGLVEVPKSQSSDRLLKQADDIKLEMKGSIHLDADIPMEAYTLTYLEGSDNYLRFPVKLLDRNGRITFVLRHGKDNSILHTFFCSISTILELMSNTSPTSSSSRDSDASEGHDEVFLVDEDESELQKPLSEISISSSTSSTTESAPHSSGQSVNQRDLKNEAALKILARNSIVLLAKQMSGEEGHLLGVVLGMKSERINQIYKINRHSGSLANFYILYEWRGRRVHPDQAGQLVRGLQDIDRADLATTVTNVLKKNRTLSSADFETEIPKRKARR